MQAPHVLPGTLFADRFCVEQIAGSGGMGTVYRALDQHTGQRVALKILNRSGSLLESERFLREASLLAELRHPGIVAYAAHGQDAQGTLYLAMEWLDGEDLAARLQHGPLSIADAIALLRGTTAALTVAHEHGVIHRVPKLPRWRAGKRS